MSKNMLITVFVVTLSVFIFAFVIWRKLKDDYQHDQIFYLTILLLLGGVGGLLAGIKLFQRDYLLSFIGGLVILGLYGIKKLKFRIFEATEAIVPAVLWLVLFAYPSYLLRREQIFNIVIEIGLAAMSLLSYYFFSKNYRRFYWYPSGKIGFAGLMAAAFYFLGRLGIAIFQSLMLSFAENWPELFLNFFAALICLITVYYRSGRRDFKKI